MPGQEGAGVFTGRLRRLGLAALAVVLAATGVAFMSAGGPAGADVAPVPWGPAQQVPGLAALSGGGTSELGALSCSSAGDCAARGPYHHPPRHIHASVL